MRSAWIRGVGFFGAVVSLAAACSVGVEPPPGVDGPGSRLLQITIGGGSNIDAGAPLPGVGGAFSGSGGSAQSSSSSSSVGVGVGVGGAPTSGASSSSSSVGVGGAPTSGASSSSSSVGVGGAPTSGASSSASSTTSTTSTSGASSSSTGIMTTLPSGAPCVANGDCQSVSCVDGVCCNGACAGTCVACSAAKKGGGPDGVCGSIAVGLDPDSECAVQGGCGMTGACSGSPSCALAPATTSCASCAATEGYVYPSLCDGSGACVLPQPASCGFYRCAAAACLTTCQADTDCISTAHCLGGTCQKKAPQGSACTGNSACSGGLSCVDGVCCDSACAGSCMACTNAKTGSGADGVCANIAAATDPDGECPDPAPQSPCAAPGVCNGNGACAPPAPANVPCGNGSCSGNPGTAFGPSACDGLGVCTPGITTACTGPCNGTICQKGCMNDAQCPSTEYCAGMMCAPKKGLGIPCGGAVECSVGYCVQGVCCDSACNTGGACQTCLKTAGVPNDGTCTLLNGKLPGYPCDDGKQCTDDACGGGACVHPAVVCAAPGPCMEPGVCDDATGACTSAPTTCPGAALCKLASTCDPTTGQCAEPGAISCPAPSDACHMASACDESTGKCLAEQPVTCPVGGLADCLTRVCDVTATNGPCVVRSSLDGVACHAGAQAGICLAGSCFTVTGIEGTGGGAGGVAATSSNATGASAATGAVGVGGEGGGGAFHFAGGACNIVNMGKSSLEGEVGRAAWLLAAALFAARRRAARAGLTARRGSRDA